METKIFGYPKYAVQKDKEARLQWAKENEMVFTTDELNVDEEIDKNLFDWDICHEPIYLLCGADAVNVFNSEEDSCKITAETLTKEVGRLELLNELATFDEIFTIVNGWIQVKQITKEQFEGIQNELKPRLLASKFLAWYTADSDTQQILGRRTSERMQSTGYGDISVNELFDECGEIPEYIFENYTAPLGEAEYKYYAPHEIEFINDLKK